LPRRVKYMSSKLGFAVVGCGNIGPFHAEAIAHIEEAELRAVCDVVAKNAEQMAEKYHADSYSDLEEVLKRDDVDIMNICLPSGMHEEAAVAAAEAGKHLVIEKPLDITLEKCDRIIEASERNNVKLAVIFPSRFGEPFLRARQAIDEGRFGKLVLGDAQVKWYRSHEYYDSGGWRGTWEMDGGGALMNQSIHSIDCLQALMGDVESVYARCETLVRKIEVEDTAVAVLKFTNGALGIIEGATSIYPGLDARIGIHGENGSAVLEAGNLVAWEFTDKRDEDATALERKKESSGAKDPTKFIDWKGHHAQLADMVKAVKEDRKPIVDGYEGRKAVEIIVAVYKSARDGTPVELPL